LAVLARNPVLDMNSAFWHGLIDRRCHQYRKIKAARMGKMGVSARCVLLALMCLGFGALMYAALVGKERSGGGQREMGQGGDLQRAGARRLIDEGKSADNRSRGVGLGKEGKRSKKASNLDMIGEQEVPTVVVEEITALVAADDGQAGHSNEELFECDRQSPLTDICTLRGDVRINVQTGEIVLYAKDQTTPRGVLLARPYPRKWDFGVMKDVSELRLLSVDAASKFPDLHCTSYHEAPAAVFSVGGYCGGAFHDFNEVFLPLFQTVHRFKRDVVLLVADLKGPWWWRGARPAESLVGAMTQHRIGLLGRLNDTEDQEQGVQCFHHVSVGLSHNLCMYDEFGGQETRSESLAGVRLSEFAPYVAGGLQLLPRAPPHVAVPEGATPVVGILQRVGTRVLVNYEQMLAAAEREGYQVLPILLETLPPREAVRRMQQIDVLVAVHGAGLAHVALMRPGGVVMQILPYGEWGQGRRVGREYRTLADYQGAKYLEWNVPLQDTSLIDVYPLTDPVLMDPDR
jgi:hypothetical protein